MAIGLTLLIVVLGFALLYVGSRLSSRPCSTWLAWLVEIENPFFRNNNSTTIISHAGIREGMRALDFGCGPGRLTIPLARAVGVSGFVMACDIQQKMLEMVERKAQANTLLNIRAVRCDGNALRMIDDQFDRIFLINVLGEIHDRQGLLRKLRPLLKADGLLCVTEVVADPDFMSYETVRQLCATAGFAEHASHGGRFAYTVVRRKL